MKSYRFDNDHTPLPIGKIVCLARTYQKHAKEMKTVPPPNPLLFLKPVSSVIFSNETIRYPRMSHCIHHEIEVGVVIGKTASCVSPKEALRFIKGYLVGLDITARDIQATAKKNGWPWGIAKGFDTFAPLSNVVSAEKVSDPNNISFRLWVNSNLRQQGSTANLIWSIESLISYISTIMTLERGDLILTGTPEGVGELQIGDKMRAELSDLTYLEVSVAEE